MLTINNFTILDKDNYMCKGTKNIITMQHSHILRTSPNGHTMVYTNSFVVHLSYFQNIK
jgi:hypothetical protein